MFDFVESCYSSLVKNLPLNLACKQLLKSVTTGLTSGYSESRR